MSQNAGRGGRGRGRGKRRKCCYNKYLANCCNVLKILWMLSFNAHKECLQSVGYRPSQFQNIKDIFFFSFSATNSSAYAYRLSETRLCSLSCAQLGVNQKICISCEPLFSALSAPLKWKMTWVCTVPDTDNVLQLSHIKIHARHNCVKELLNYFLDKVEWQLV